MLPSNSIVAAAGAAYACLFLLLPWLAQTQAPTSTITILGCVYCYHNTFSNYTHFLPMPGVDVNVECKARSDARSSQDVSVSVNTSTDRYGMYKVEINHPQPRSSLYCKATLIQETGLGSCKLATTKTTSSSSTSSSSSSSTHFTHYTYTLGALSYRPPQRNITFCGNNQTILIHDSIYWNTSMFFLPYIPPSYVFPQLPPLPQLPPFPQLPPLPQLPPFPQLPPLPPLPPFPQLPPLPPLPQFPPFPSFPFPPNPPSLPFPFPSIPPPQVFNIWDPKTWVLQPTLPATP